MVASFLTTTVRAQTFAGCHVHSQLRCNNVSSTTVSSASSSPTCPPLAGKPSLSSSICCGAASLRARSDATGAILGPPVSQREKALTCRCSSTSSSFIGTACRDVMSINDRGVFFLRSPAKRQSIIIARIGGAGGGAGGRGGGSRFPGRPMPYRGQKGRRDGDDGDRDGLLINESIRCPEVRLLDEEQNMMGVVSTMDALNRAEEAELDLVLIAPEAEPPVARIMDYSKYKYDQEKKKRDMKKKAAATRSEQKELKMRYNIDSHDYNVRLRAAQRFLRAGDKVKVSAQFKGREMEFRELGVKLFERFQNDCAEDGVVETKPMMEGRTMLMVLMPNKIALQRAQSTQAKIVKPPS